MERKMGGKNGVTRPFHLALLCLAPLCCFLPFSNGSAPFFFFGATFVMMLLILAHAASGVTFYVLKKEKAWLMVATNKTGSTTN